MNEDRFWLLVSLKLSGEARPEEISELEMLLKQYPEMGLRINMMNAVWQSSGKPVTNDKEKKASFNKHMQRLSNHFSEPVLQYDSPETEEYEEEKTKVKPFVRSRLLWISGIAASVLLVWFVAFYVPQKNNSKETTAQNTVVTTKRGSKTKIQLPDGTQVWLNADSKITYNEKFQGALREVYLTGEAFFDVVRNEAKPFVIHTHSIDVKVLGTSFNVRSYEDEKNTETSLIHGSVEVTLHSDPVPKYKLKPGQKLIVQNSGLPVLSKEPEARKDQFKHPLLAISKINYEKKDSSIIETLWVKNKLAFDGEAFEDVALKIERWFDVKVNITDERLRKVPYTGVFDNESLQVVMEALQLTGKFKYTINRKEVTIGR